MRQAQETRFITSTKSGTDSSSYTIILYGSKPIDRMRSFGAKSFLQVTKLQTVIDLQIEAIRTVYPKSEVILVSGFDFDKSVKIKPTNVKIIENSRFEETNEIEDIKIGVNASLNPNIIIISSDIIFNASALVQLKNRGSCVLLDSKKQFSPEDVGCTWNDTRVEMLAYGIPNQWCHIAQFSGKELELLKKFVNLKGKGSLVSYEAINYIVKNGGKICPVSQVSGHCRKVEKPEDIYALYS